MNALLTVDEHALEQQRAQEAVASKALVAKADAIEIKTTKEAEAAVEALGEVKARLKELEEARVHTKEPALEAGRRIDDVFKALKAPLDEIAERLKDGILEFRKAEDARIAEERRIAAEAEAAEIAAAEAKRQADENEARQRREAAARQVTAAESAAKKGDHDAEAQAEAARQAEEQAKVEEMVAQETRPVVTTAAPIADQQTTIKAGGAAATFRKVWKFEVEDATRVPDAYRVVDEKLIRAAVADGAREIPGVRIYAEEQVATKRAA